MSREFGAGLVSHETVAMSSRAALSEGLTGVAGAAPKVAHSLGWYKVVWAVGRRPQFFSTWTSP